MSMAPAAGASTTGAVTQQRELLLVISSLETLFETAGEFIEGQNGEQVLQSGLGQLVVCIASGIFGGQLGSVAMPAINRIMIESSVAMTDHIAARRYARSEKRARRFLHALQYVGWPILFFSRQLLHSVDPEIGKLGRDQGFRKFLPQTYG
jgi:hypothetical protein